MSRPTLGPGFDAGDDHVDVARGEMPDAVEHGVGRGAVDLEGVDAVEPGVGALCLKVLSERERGRHSGLVECWRDDQHVGKVQHRLSEMPEAGGFDAVVVGGQDEGSVGHGGSVSAAPAGGRMPIGDGWNAGQR